MEYNNNHVQDFQHYSLYSLFDAVASCSVNSCNLEGLDVDSRHVRTETGPARATIRVELSWYHMVCCLMEQSKVERHGEALYEAMSQLFMFGPNI